MSRHRLGRVIAVVLLGVGTLCPAAEPTAQTRRMLADRFVQLAQGVLDGRLPSKATADGVTGGRFEERRAVAHQLLTRASLLAPDDAEVTRLWIESALSDPLGRRRGPEMLEEDERRSLREALGRYLRLRPDDDTAQLLLVELLAADAQTVEQRLTIFQRIVEGGGSRLSAALRSRVAMHAAALQRARGEEAEYARLVRTALSLDAAHVEAAEAAYRFLAERDVEPLERAQAMLTLVNADPARPESHALLASMLHACGLAGQATDWYASAADLLRWGAGSSGIDRVELVRLWALSLWGEGRIDDAASLIESMRTPPAEAQDEQTARLPAELAGVLLAIREAQQRPADADAAFGELVDAIQRRGEAPDAADELTITWARLLYDRQIDRVRGQADQIVERLDASGQGQEGASEALIARLRGWLALREGQAQQARRLLESCADQDPSCQLGLLYLDESNEALSDSQRIEAWNALWRRTPDSVIGAIAAERIRRLGGRAQPSPRCMRIARLIGQVPRQLLHMPDQPYRFVRLRARVVRPDVGFAEPISVELALKNLSSMPLSIGQRGTLPATVALVAGSSRSEWAPATMVVDMARRIRLEPGEEVAVETRLSHWRLAQHMASDPEEDLSISVTAILNPLVASDGPGRLRPGLLGRSVSAGSVRREGVDPAAAFEAFEKAEAADDAAALMSSAARLAVMARRLAPEADADRQRLSALLTRALDRGEDVFGAWLVSYLPTEEGSDWLSGPLLDRAVQEGDGTVLEALLVTHARSPDAPILNAALRRQDEAAGDLPRRWRSILRAARGQSAGDQDRSDRGASDQDENQDADRIDRSGR